MFEVKHVVKVIRIREQRMMYHYMYECQPVLMLPAGKAAAICSAMAPMPLAGREFSPDASILMTNSNRREVTLRSLSKKMPPRNGLKKRSMMASEKPSFCMNGYDWAVGSGMSISKGRNCAVLVQRLHLHHVAQVVPDDCHQCHQKLTSSSAFSTLLA